MIDFNWIIFARCTRFARNKKKQKKRDFSQRQKQNRTIKTNCSEPEVNCNSKKSHARMLIECIQSVSVCQLRAGGLAAGLQLLLFAFQRIPSGFGLHDWPSHIIK